MVTYKVVSDFDGNDAVEFEVGAADNPYAEALEILGYYLVKVEEKA